MELEFSQQTYEKFCNIKFHENPSTETPEKRTDGGADNHNEANSRFSQFW
jgi:hypothetical protein